MINQARFQFSFKHSGSFTLLFILSVIQPPSFLSHWTVPMVPLVLVTIMTILLFKIYKSIGFGSFIVRNKKIISLLFFYILLCATSLMINHYRYENVTEFFNWGLIFILVQGSLPAACLMFFLPQTNSSISFSRFRLTWALPLAIAVIIPATALWQRVDQDSASIVMQYFISSNLNDDSNIRGILAISTDLGAITAILFISCLLLSINLLGSGCRKAFVVMSVIAILNLIAGVNSGARNFFLMAGTGFICMVLLIFKHNVITTLLTLTVIALSVIYGLQLAPTNAALKSSGFLPFILPLNLGIGIIPSDFIPSFNIYLFGEDRISLWSNAVSSIYNHPLFGISNGGFRLKMEALGGTRVNNTHNILFQSAVDAGIFATIVLLVLFRNLIKGSKKHLSSILLIMASVGLLVDNFSDHSLPWILIVTYAVSILHQLDNTSLVKYVPIKHYTNKLISSSVLTVSAAMIITYKIDKHKIEKLSPELAIEKVYPLFARSHWEESPTFVTPLFVQDMTEERWKGKVSLLPILKFNTPCNYLYPESMFFVLNKNIGPTENYRRIGTDWGITSDMNIICQTNDTNPFNLEEWVSNHSIHFARALNTDGKLWLGVSGISYFSPIFSASDYSQINFTVKPPHTEQVDLQIDLVSGITGDVIQTYFEQVNIGTHSIKVPLKHFSSKVFIRLKLHTLESGIKKANEITIINVIGVRSSNR